MSLAENNLLLVDARASDERLPLRAPGVSDILNQVAAPPEHIPAAPFRSADAALPPGWPVNRAGVHPGLTEGGASRGVPFIDTSLAPRKEAAAEFMSVRPMDCIRQDLLVRLTSAIKRQLQDAVLRAEQARVPQGSPCTQEALLQSERLRAIGQMAAGIAHDLKNILNPLDMRLQLLDRQVLRADAEAIHRNIEEMHGILKTGVQTIERLQSFVRQAAAARPQAIDVNQVSHEALELARPRMTGGPGIPCVMVEEFGTPPPILGNRSEIVSALVNLVINAIDAMPDGGTIRVRTEAAQGGAMIQVLDNGPGMTPHVEQHVFEPFFSTKGAAGMGLGLAMVYMTVQCHAGTIALRTELGKGTSFTLWFPAMPAQ